MAIQIEGFTFNNFQENTYLLIDEKKDCVIIDPGCSTRAEENFFLEFIRNNQLNPVALLNTHAHLDHIMGNQFIQTEFNLDHYLHKDDLPTLESAPRSAAIYGIPDFTPSPTPNKLLNGGEKLKFGNIELEVLFTPGHAPGHVVFYNEKEKFVINGDVLFRGSFGRYDLPGGNLETLKKSIKEVMFKLPEDTIVYSGHGPATSIGNEKYSNPILNY